MRRVAVALVMVVPLMFAGGVAHATGDAGPQDEFVPQECEDGNVIYGTMDPDVLNGTFCDDVIFGLRGGDRIRGEYGVDDVIFGLRGGDRIRGEYGVDQLFGNRGDDLISDPSDEGNIYGGRGWDTCVVRAGSNINLHSCEVVVEV